MCWKAFLNLGKDHAALRSYFLKWNIIVSTKHSNSFGMYIVTTFLSRERLEDVQYHKNNNHENKKTIINQNNFQIDLWSSKHI